MSLYNKNSHIILPIIEQAEMAEEREIIGIFLHYFRDYDGSSIDTKVFRAIGKAAELTGYSDAVIARMLVHCGLRSSRRSLPQEFLNHVDMTAYRQQPMHSYADLKEFWSEECGENLNLFNPVIYQAEIMTFIER